MTNDQAVAELNAKCMTMRPDELAALEKTLKGYGLKFLAHIVHMQGVYNCGADDYADYLDDLDARYGSANGLTSANMGNF
jgi:hypothetical protein